LTVPVRIHILRTGGCRCEGLRSIPSAPRGLLGT